MIRRAFAHIADPAFRAGVSIGLFLSVAALLGGNFIAESVTWARDHFQVVVVDGHPVVIEESHQ